jgi:hypothetical protein
VKPSHLGVENDWDGQDQAQPEPVPELRGVVPVAAMPTVGAVASRPAVLIRLGVLAMLVRRQLIGRTVVGSSVASVVLMRCHLASPRPH